MNMNCTNTPRLQKNQAYPDFCVLVLYCLHSFLRPDSPGDFGAI